MNCPRVLDCTTEEERTTCIAKREEVYRSSDNNVAFQRHDDEAVVARKKAVVELIRNHTVASNLPSTFKDSVVENEAKVDDRGMIRRSEAGERVARAKRAAQGARGTSATVDKPRNLSLSYLCNKGGPGEDVRGRASASSWRASRKVVVLVDE